uniref:F-box protein 40 n=1 Tax=Salvator merianae TaxID=96440 RepID=A0A8D0BWL2_SALMN
MLTGYRRPQTAVMGRKQQTSHSLHKHCEKCFSRNCQAPIVPTVSCVVIHCRSRCGASFHMCKEDEHQLLCPLEEIPCFNSVYGCPLTMARFKAAKHLQVCPASIVSCSMQWNRWPRLDSEAILHENIMKEEPNEECLDVALALRDQNILFNSLKMAELFPECKEVLDEETAENDVFWGDEAVSSRLAQSGGENAEAEELSQEERDRLAKEAEGLDLCGYKAWENMFSKEYTACKLTGIQADSVKSQSGSSGRGQAESHSSGQTSSSNVEEKKSDEAISMGENAEEQAPAQVNLAAEKTGFAPWQDGVLERLKAEVPIGDYNMYLVHHGRMLIHFGQMAACTPKEKDFVYGNLEAQEVKTVTTFRVPVSYCGKRARLGDALAHKKPSKSITVDTSELGINPEDLPKSNTVEVTLLCALEKELRGHVISATNSTDALYVDFGTQTYNFAMEPFSSTAVLADVLDAENPPDLRLQLCSESVTQRHNKSNSAFTFSCNHVFRRDEFPSHFKNVHTDIQSSLDGWFQRRCPLAYLGCSFVQYPWCLSGQKSSITYNQHLQTFAVKPQVDPMLLETKKYNLTRGHVRKEIDSLSSLPLEILKYIAGYLDSFSLSQLSQVSVQMRDICATLLQERGMVVLLWEKKRYSHGGTSWRVRRKIWKFSSLFSTVNNWQFSGIPSMAEHLKTCPFYDVECKKDPVLLACIFTAEEEKKESLVSTFRNRSGQKNRKKRVY